MEGALLAAFASLALAAGPAPAIPEGWQALKINDRKKPTEYRLITEGGKPVLHARAEASASGLFKRAGFRIAERPIAAWSWKVSRLIPGADNRKKGREDSPARIVLQFGGDRDKLPASDRLTLYVGSRLSGQEAPYATLVYIWSNDVPVGTVIENPNTRRVQMVVASSGAAGVGAWQSLARDVVADFRRAFKEEPGPLLSYGVMTDTDNTGETVEAWYGPLEFRSTR